LAGKKPGEARQLWQCHLGFSDPAFDARRRYDLANATGRAGSTGGFANAESHANYRSNGHAHSRTDWHVYADANKETMTKKTITLKVIVFFVSGIPVIYNSALTVKLNHAMCEGY
jgi:hypothetical protein